MESRGYKHSTAVWKQMWK